ncbi:MAG: hypothetical protein DMF59_20330 [Acidobacteria bacterium]|nr:MAG: hypothetical protein DMF59_20330 [Acidobacteriota bacterium]
MIAAGIGDDGIEEHQIHIDFFTVLRGLLRQNSGRSEEECEGDAFDHGHSFLSRKRTLNLSKSSRKLESTLFAETAPR